ncbi:MAG: type II toxin-antitoxin system prevent-host-death family antitoxin [Salinarimonas sp.]
MIRVRSRKFLAHAARYLSRARCAPLMITREGKDDVVLLSIREYRRLSSLDTRRHHTAVDLPDDLVAALEVVKAPAWSARYNHELES